MTRGQILLIGLGLLGLGAGGYGLFQASGYEGFSAGIAASVVLLLVIVAWTGSYLLRVVSGRMTFSEQRRRYRAGYDAATDAALEARFAALPAAEQARLLRELGLESDQPIAETLAGPTDGTPGTSTP